uniref:Quorum-sensing-regulated virulence factor n=1 Tax=viral metagenome TaxID=1070528 RepID=A0A6M3M7U4_9ZZZZ
MRIQFGKYATKEIELIPSGYLTWLLEQDWMYEKKHEELLEAIEYEMAVRDRSDGHFYTEGG